MISHAEQAAIMQECLTLVKAKTPNPATRGITSTGNLMTHGVQFEDKGNGVWEIWVDGEPPDIGQAPYMPYTTEPWISPRWHGKKNPNEGWWDRVAKEVIDLIATRLGGNVEEQ